jgi:hypothetical protein
VFTYLAELHDRKLNSGHLQQGPVMPVLEAGATAAADNSEAASSGSYQPQGVTAIVTLPTVEDEQLRQKQQQYKGSSTTGEVGGSSGAGGYGRKALPASVQLHPSVQRGKKSMATKIKRKLTKARFTECSIQ